MSETPETIPDAALETERQLIAAEVPIADLLDLAVRLKGIQNPPRVVAETAAPIPVGTVQTFWASNQDDDTNFQVQARAGPRQRPRVLLG